MRGIQSCVTVTNRARRTAALCAFILTLVFAGTMQAQSVVLRVDGENGLVAPNLPDPGDTWENAYKFLQDAVARAEFLFSIDEADDVQIWVAATPSTNPYRPDQSAADEAGSMDPLATSTSGTTSRSTEDSKGSS